MTRSEFAKMIGVSVSAISKTFSGSWDVNEETRERILSEAKRLGCYQQFDKGLHSRRLFGILCPEPESEYYGIMCGILERKFGELNCDTVIAYTRFDREREAELFSLFAYRLHVNGIIVIGNRGELSNPDKVPLVFIGSEENKEADSVRLMTFEAIVRALSLLKSDGHRDVAFLGETYTLDRLNQYQEAMRRVGLPLRPDRIVIADERFEAGGYRAMQMLAERGPLPTAAFCAYDYLAFGAMRYLREHGLSVPENISLIGMNDLPYNRYLGVSLTSAGVDLEKVCEMLVRLLFRKIKNRYVRERKVMYASAELQVRDSVAPPKTTARGS